MKTDAKTIAEIYRHMADNLDAGIDQLEGIGYLQLTTQKWVKKETIIFDFEHIQYCILPKTITVNGVEIPKPLSIEDLKNGNIYFFPALTLNLFDSCHRDWLTENKVKFIYKTKEEAIEASKKLFGIE